MAKKSYEARDEYGIAWLVKAGDPAFSLVADLAPKCAVLVLPRGMLMSGRTWDLDAYRRLAEAKASRMAVYLETSGDDDAALLMQLVLFTSLCSCLSALAAGMMHERVQEEAAT